MLEQKSKNVSPKLLADIGNVVFQHFFQNVSWPEIGTEFAKRTIDLTSSPVPVNAYNETARRVQKAFEEHGASRLVSDFIA